MTRKQKISLGCLTVLVAGLAAMALFILKLGGDASSELDKEIARTKAEGLWDASVTDLLHPVDADKNAAPTLSRAMALSEKIKLPVSRDLDDPDDRHYAESYLSQMKPALDIAIEASKYPGCYFEHDFTNLYKVLFPELAQAKGLVKALCLRSDLELRDGRGQDSVNDLTAAAKIAHFSGNSPSLIGTLVQIACDTLVMGQIEKNLTHQPKLAREYEAVLTALGPLPPIRDSMRTEDVASRQLFSKPIDDDIFSQDTDPSANMRFIAWMSRFKLVRDRWMLGAIRYHRQIFEKISQDPRTSNLINSAQNVATQLDHSKRFEDLGMQTFGGVFPYSTEAFERDQALRRMTAQALKIVEAPTPPAELPLPGEAAQDPRNDQPLHYKRTAKGFRLYALGVSGVDHGGVRSGNRVPLQEADLVFDYPYVKPYVSPEDAKKNKELRKRQNNMRGD